MLLLLYFAIMSLPPPGEEGFIWVSNSLFSISPKESGRWQNQWILQLQFEVYHARKMRLFFMWLNANSFIFLLFMGKSTLLISPVFFLKKSFGLVANEIFGAHSWIPPFFFSFPFLLQQCGNQNNCPWNPHKIDARDHFKKKKNYSFHRRDHFKFIDYGCRGIRPLCFLKRKRRNKKKETRAGNVRFFLPFPSKKHHECIIQECKLGGGKNAPELGAQNKGEGKMEGRKSRKVDERQHGATRDLQNK